MSPQDHLRTAARLARLLDAQFGIGKFKFGLDPLLGLIPGGGDLISLLLGSYIIWIALQMNIPRARIIQMIVNLVIDFLVGFVPIIGDFLDFFIQPNLKNLEIIKRHSNPSS